MKPDAIFLPIEPLEERYSAQMLRWVQQAFMEIGVTYRTLLPKSTYDNIAHGQWLDTYGTTRYRSKQMEMVVKMFEKGEVKNGAVFVVGDVWYPGIEAIKLMADLSNINVKVVGWHYAGTADPADLLHRSTGHWALEWESWLVRHYLDAICVGSKFHADLLDNAFDTRYLSQVYPLGLAWRPFEVQATADLNMPKEKIVVFPHRIAPEKNPETFYHIAEVFASTPWAFAVATSNPNVARAVENDPKARHVEVVYTNNKKAYYDFLKSCSIYYSNATQETFGYALHEAIALGLAVVAPNRCSYPEMLQNDPRFLYETHTDPTGMALLGKMMDNPVAVPFEYTAKWDANETKFLKKIFEP